MVVTLGELAVRYDHGNIPQREISEFQGVGGSMLDQRGRSGAGCDHFEIGASGAVRTQSRRPIYHYVLCPAVHQEAQQRTAVDSCFHQQPGSAVRRGYEAVQLDPIARGSAGQMWRRRRGSGQANPESCRRDQTHPCHYSTHKLRNRYYSMTISFQMQ